MSKKCKKDQYYTKNEVARHYSQIVINRYGKDNIYVEPSAGTGAFAVNFDNIICYDIEPKFEGCLCSNFMDVVLSENQIVVGNPPFGFAGSLAVKFFNHAAKYKVKAVCFIFPKSFKKNSLQNRLDLNYNLVYQEDAPKKSFVFDEQEYDVPCVFQIWELGTPRKFYVPPENTYFDVCNKEVADLAIRRVGGKAGKVLDGLEHNENSTYFIKSKVDNLKEKLDNVYVDLKEVASNTAGVRSISVSEIVECLNKGEKN